MKLESSISVRSRGISIAECIALSILSLQTPLFHLSLSHYSNKQSNTLSPSSLSLILIIPTNNPTFCHSHSLRSFRPLTCTPWPLRRTDPTPHSPLSLPLAACRSSSCCNPRPAETRDRTPVRTPHHGTPRNTRDSTPLPP